MLKMNVVGKREIHNKIIYDPFNFQFSLIPKRFLGIGDRHYKETESLTWISP